jgi:nitrogen-specific signal transduction histidine kinase
MPVKSLSDILAAARQMISAAKANQDQLTVPGGSEAFIQKGAEMLAALEAANLEQERLKGLLKSTTAQVESLQAAVTDWQSQANAAVKISFRKQKEKWVEFGLKAKR